MPGMTKSRGILAPRRRWTEPELQLLRALYPELHAADVAVLMERSVAQIYNAAFKTGLRKSAEYLASDTAARIRRGKQHPNMITSQFKAGHRTWNTGMKGWSAPGTEATRFKPGTKPHTTLPLGTYRINADGCLERKVSERSGAPHLRWQPVSRIVWEAAHGPVPAGHVVAFKAGRKTTVLERITLDALECISRGELARRNHPRARSPELAKLVQLKGAITRQVNRINREAAQAKEARA
ncbi:MAG: HNH endonuclease [Candidatus Uhrbacteria bacterium]|nr:HNH endonuclease [Candidatus Uhrbacteria bacterium]